MYNRIYSLLHLLFNNLVAVMSHRKPTILSMITYDAIAIDHNDDDHFKNGQIAAINQNEKLVRSMCSAPTFSVSVEQIKMSLLIG